MSKAQTPRESGDAEAASGSAERSLRLLALVANEGRALSLADLATRLALPKATAHRICTQLVANGFLLRDVDERSFNVGPALRRLAFDTLNHGSVRGLRHAVLAELVVKVGETWQLHDARRHAGALTSTASRRSGRSGSRSKSAPMCRCTRPRAANSFWRRCRRPHAMR